MNVKNLVMTGAVALLLPVFSWAGDDMAETGWLHLVEGYRGDTAGAQVQKIETDEVTGEQKLTISIPKIAITDPGQMEEVVVIGQAPEESKPLFDFKYETEWVDDYDNDNYGLVIRLGKESNWPIRLFMHSDDGPRTYTDITKP